MATARNKFLDRGYDGPDPPENDRLYVDDDGAVVYDWPINHSDEDDFGRQRNVEMTASTGGQRLVMQQGDPEPLILRLRGTILTFAQHEMMWAWWVWSTYRTVEFHDFDGNQYEVQILAYKPTRVRVADNPRDRENAPHHIWRYSIEMLVVNVLSGDWDWGYA